MPIYPIQETNMIAKGGFDFLSDHRVCPQGKTLRRSTFNKKNLAYQYVALQKDCQACSVKADCLPPGQKRRYISLTMYYPVYLRARDRNGTAEYQREGFRRRTIAEGTFASLDWLSTIPAAGIEKGGLRGIYGRPGPRHVENGTQVEPRRRAS